MIRHLPLQLSVTDERGVLRYWQGDLFDDCDPGYIGRHVDDCHNQRSQDTIARMETAFREGTQSEAVFRRLEADRLVLVRYCPLRDSRGTYRGMMETMQDITDIRLLDGEKLTLDW